MNKAESDTENAALLTDGDLCVSPASAGWIWQGESASFHWQEPVQAELLILYPAAGAMLKGSAVINGALQASFDLPADEKPGQAVILLFSETPVESLELRLDSPGALGEVMLLGKLDRQQ